MNVLLVYNRNAGDGKLRSKDLRRLIESQGHTVRVVRKKDDDLERHVVQPFDLVAVAGGDGTVTMVARMLRGRSPRFTVLPLGTANNLAHSLGIQVNAGHGINYQNLEQLLAGVPCLHELNIGHTIVSRALFVGMEQAVREMRQAIDRLS